MLEHIEIDLPVTRKLPVLVDPDGDLYQRGRDIVRAHLANNIGPAAIERFLRDRNDLQPGMAPWQVHTRDLLENWISGLARYDKANGDWFLRYEHDLDERGRDIYTTVPLTADALRTLLSDACPPLAVRWKRKARTVGATCLAQINALPEAYRHIAIKAVGGP
jgi:hypothetical protein